MAAAAGLLILDPDGRLLLLKRADGAADYPGHWGLPAGHVEDGESDLDAAIRESVEEIGDQPIEVDPSVALGDDAFVAFGALAYEPFEPMLNDEHTDAVWADLADLPEPMHPGAMIDQLVQLASSRTADASRVVVRGVRDDAGRFEENKHPRGDDGKFAPGGGGGSSKPTEAARHVDGKWQTASGGAVPEHIEKLKIPPAWTDVRYNPDPGAALQAVGKDAKGRVQAVYSDAHHAQAAAAKFARINELSQKFPEVSAQNDKARRSSNPATREAADCLALVMATGIRPGSDADTGADKKAYGATTLLADHVEKTKDGVVLNFVGKKGVSLSIPVKDPGLSKMLVKRAADAGPGGKLFNTNDGALLDHVKSLDGGGFKTKDFRTHVGTSLALKEVAGMPAPTDEKSYRKAVAAVAKTVSTALGNTPTVALQSYISPAVFASWRSAL